MKTTTILFRFAIALLSASLAYSAAWDLRMVQFDASNRSRDVIIAPAANSLLGFDASKRAVNVTPGTNIAISGNQISAAGNVTNNGTLTDNYLVMGGGGASVRPTTIQVTGGNNIVLENLTANSTSIGNITGATSDFDLLIGDQATGRFIRGSITIGANMTRTKVGNNIELDSTAGGGTPDDESVTTPKFAASALVTSTEGLASSNNDTSVPTVKAVKDYADGISAGSTPPGASILWDTSDLANMPGGFFAAGEYGTAAGAALGSLSPITRSLGTVANPTVDIAPGAVPAGTVVTMNTTTPGAFFTVTTNGTDPDYTVGTVGGNFTISANTTVEYRANKQGWVSSAVQSGTWTIDPIPTLSSAVLQASGTDIVIGWPESVSYGAGGTGGYALTLSGGAATVTGVTGGGTNSHTLTVNRTVTNTETGTLAYTQPGNGAEDSAFQDVVTFTGFTVNTSGGPAGGGGGPSLIASLGEGAPTGGGGFTTSAINTTGANFIVVAKVWYNAEPTLSDSNANTYSASTTQVIGSLYIRQHYVRGGTVGSGHTFTLTGSGHYGAIAVMAFSNIAATPFDQEATNNASAWTALTAGSITPSQANTVSIPALLYDNGSGTLTQPTGYTLGPVVPVASGDHIGVALAFKVLSSAAAVNPEWTASTSYLYGVTSHVNYKY